MDKTPLRFGILGAARIAPMALIQPARLVDGAEVTAVAARDLDRARAFAKRHGLARAYGSYDELLAAPDIDVIYNPLPNSLHAQWTIAALRAGKHVLCEKPLASNAQEAAAMAQAAQESGRVLMEAFHYRFHPLMARILELVRSELGQVEHIETYMCIPLPLPGNIRYRLDLGGGATMDVGAYAIHMLRTIAGAEPTVTQAQALLSSPGVDRAMTADFRFDDGRTGHIECSLWSMRLLKIGIRVRGAQGELRVLNATVPQFYHRLTLKTQSGTRREKVPGEATYTHQLRAFVAAVRQGQTPLVTPADSIANMRIIDAVYRAAGLSPRGQQP